MHRKLQGTLTVRSKSHELKCQNKFVQYYCMKLNKNITEVTEKFYNNMVISLQKTNGDMI